MGARSAASVGAPVRLPMRLPLPLPLLLLSALAGAAQLGAPEANADSLRQVLLVHRHGDRTPIRFTAADPLRGEPLWALFGAGQLTNEGKRRLFELGRAARLEYGRRLLADSADKSHVEARSSAVPRCLESAQLFLAGLLGLDGSDGVPEARDAASFRWDNASQLAQRWQPVGVQSVPESMDGMLASASACTRLEAEYARILNSSEFKDKALSQVRSRSLYGVKLDSVERVLQLADNLLIERQYFPDRLPPEALALYDDLQRAADIGFGFCQATRQVRRLRAGLLVGSLLRQMERARAKPRRQAKRLVEYSTHDSMLSVLLGVLEAWADRRPGYGASLALELHEEAGRWHVRALYAQQAPGPRLELALAGCGTRCPLDHFKRLLEPYAIADWMGWMTECGNSLAHLNPYRQSARPPAPKPAGRRHAA